MLCYRCGSHVPDMAERCGACGQRQVGTARMASATGLRKKLNPALLAGAPYREGELMAHRYLVKDAVGVGPLGFVLRTSDRELGIDVSVKLIHPRFVQTGEEREAFRNALEPARRFLHPSLTRLHDVGVDQGWPYFTYTFLDGLPLRRIIDLRLAKGQTFAPDEVEPILGQLMAALEAAHPAGAHGGLKAENILVLPDMLKVTDWGVAAGMPRPPFVQAERQKSVHRHLAPEYLAGLALEPRADVYSLGVLVGEMLTGLTPEDEIPELRLVNPDLPDAIEGFYRRALSERPEARFRSVREMFEAFCSVVEGKPLPAAVSTEVAVDDGFEVDFVEAQTVVVQPEPLEAPTPAPETAAPPPEAQVVAAAPESVVHQAVAEAPVAPETVPAPVDTGPSPESVPAEAAAASAEPVDAVPPAAPSDAASPEVETPFWAEAPTSGAEANGETLWSEEEEEAEAVAAAPAAAPEAPVLSLALAPPETASPVVQSVPAAAPEAAAPVRPVPAPLPALSRIGGPSLAPASRPSVPSIGLWGPGARRTGAHAAVAVALSETSSEAQSLAPPPVEAQPTDVLPPPAVRPLPAPEAALAAAQAEAPPAPPGAPAVPTLAAPPPAEVPAPSSLRPLPTPPPLAAPYRVERPVVASAPLPPPADAADMPPSVEAGHRGGLWSPGAALAEVVSEMRAEDARRLANPESDAVPTAKAAQAVTEQRASRERLALMSASEEPTAPAPAVSGRPRRVPAPPPSAPKPHTVPLWQQRRAQLAAAFTLCVVIGALAAILLSKLH